MAADPLINRTLKHYRIDKLLGQGGMGAVYRATDTQLQRTVAIKLMHPQFASQRDFQERFLQEAQSVARLDHENIIRIFDSELQGTLLFMVTEYVAGGNLREYLKKLYEQRKFIALPEALTLTRQIADALNYAHAQGIMHRDIKPDNVLLKAAPAGSDSNMFRAVLTDFGLAKLAEGGVLSVADSPTGTLPYMSPEQAMAEPVDNRTDLYALGVMLYELTTGRLPFMPRNVPEAIKMHTQMAPEPPTKVRASLSPDLEKVILKAMAKRPEDRYQTGAEFVRAIRNLETGTAQPPAARQANVDEGVGRPDDMPRSGQAVRVDPIEPEQSESIGVYLQSVAQGNANPAPAIVVVANDTPNDRLVITSEDEAPRYFPLVKSPVDIGREPQMDLQLVSAKVSRHHAQIERRKDGQYTIMDMGSSNGTFLGEAKLLSNIPEVWPGDVPVRVGNYWLAVQRAAQSFNTGRPVQKAPQSMAAPGAVPMPGSPVIMNPQAQQAQTSGIAVTLKPQGVQLEAGGRDNIQVEILNQSELVEHYQFEVLNIPREWYTVPMTTLQLMPGGKGSVSIAFHPPRNCKSTAGTHEPIIKIVSQERRKELNQTPASLTINPFYQFEGDMRPRRIRNKGDIQVLITNKGNSTEVYTLAPRDREQALHFDPSDLPLQIAPCETGKAVFFVRPTRRPLIGFGSKLYGFEVGTVPGSGGNIQTLPGEVLTTPSIPWWLLAFLLLLCLLLLLLLYFFIRPQPVAVATPNNTVTAAHGTLEGWLTATANGFNGRQTATYTVRNATATQVTNLTATGTANFLATIAAQNAQATNVQATAAQSTMISNFIQLTTIANDNITKTAQAQAEPAPPK